MEEPKRREKESEEEAVVDIGHCELGGGALEDDEQESEEDELVYEACGGALYSNDLSSDEEEECLAFCGVGEGRGGFRVEEEQEQTPPRRVGRRDKAIVRQEYEEWKKEFEKELRKMDKFPTVSYQQDLKFARDSKVHKNLIPFLLDPSKSKHFNDFVLPELLPLFKKESSKLSFELPKEKLTAGQFTAIRDLFLSRSLTTDANSENA